VSEPAAPPAALAFVSFQVINRMERRDELTANIEEREDERRKRGQQAREQPVRSTETTKGAAEATKSTEATKSADATESKHGENRARDYALHGIPKLSHRRHKSLHHGLRVGLVGLDNALC